MAREMVIEYETVERPEEVVWCDECGDNCTDNHAYIVKETCPSCADEFNDTGGLVSGSKRYAEKYINNLTDKQARTVAKLFNASQIFFATAVAALFIGLSSVFLHGSPDVVVTSGDFVLMATVIAIGLSVVGYLLE